MIDYEQNDTKRTSWMLPRRNPIFLRVLPDRLYLATLVMDIVENSQHRRDIPLAHDPQAERLDAMVDVPAHRDAAAKEAIRERCWRRHDVGVVGIPVAVRVLAYHILEWRPNVSHRRAAVLLLPRTKQWSWWKTSSVAW